MRNESDIPAPPQITFNRPLVEAGTPSERIRISGKTMMLLEDVGSPFMSRELQPMMNADGSPMLDEKGNPMFVPPVVTMGDVIRAYFIILHQKRPEISAWCYDPVQFRAIVLDFADTIDLDMMPKIGQQIADEIKNLSGASGDKSDQGAAEKNETGPTE